MVRARSSPGSWSFFGARWDRGTAVAHTTWRTHPATVVLPSSFVGPSAAPSAGLAVAGVLAVRGRLAQGVASLGTGRLGAVRAAGAGHRHGLVADRPWQL